MMPERQSDAGSGFCEGQIIGLAPRYRPLCRSNERLLLAAEDEVRCIDDPVAMDIIAALQHGSDIENITGTLSRQYSVATIRTAIRTLTDEGLLHTSATNVGEIAAYWNSIGCAQANGEVSFQPIYQANHGLFRQALAAAGVRVAEHAPFLLVTTDDYLRPELASFNLRSEPWLLAKPVGHTIWIGPLFIPGRTPCWSCLARWIKPHRWQQASFYGWGDQEFPPQPSTACLPTTLALAAGMVATSIAVWLTKGSHPDLENNVVSFDTRTLRCSTSPLRFHPGCPQCRPRELRTTRQCGSLHDFLSPITGIVSMMEVTDKPVGGLFHAHSIFMPPLPAAPKARSLVKPQHAAGKALNPHEAESACLAEALERYSLIYQGTEPCIRANFDEIDALDPTNILLFSDSQYENRDEWNRAHSELHWVPERFDRSIAIDWTEAKSLVSANTKYVPAALCYMYHASRDYPESCVADTNGCAAGQSLPEAILHALLELVERDSVAIWWYNRLSRPSIDLGSLGDPQFFALERIFAEMGRQLYLLDVTTDLRIPSVVAIAPRFDGSEPCFGAAAGFSMRRAAFKAIAETAQIAFWTANGSGSDEMHHWIRNAKLGQHSYLEPLGTVDAPLDLNLEPESALQWCTQRLCDSGVEPYYVDLTRPEVGLPVVRAIAPGLRHFWARLGPGRLYDVPVRMGWSKAALLESETNPTPCMI
jgi:ribosomal protein S12 methylthiotransferase accessory factor